MSGGRQPGMTTHVTDEETKTLKVLEGFGFWSSDFHTRLVIRGVDLWPFWHGSAEEWPHAPAFLEKKEKAFPLDFQSGRWGGLWLPACVASKFSLWALWCYRLWPRVHGAEKHSCHYPFSVPICGPAEVLSMRNPRCNSCQPLAHVCRVALLGKCACLKDILGAGDWTLI